MTIEDSTSRQRPPRGTGAARPVDASCASLAGDRVERAVGIVLFAIAVPLSAAR